VPGERVQARGGGNPRRQAGDGPGNGGDDARDGSARDHDHPQLLARRPDGGEHAELALAARGDHGEACGCHQGDQEQQHRDGTERAAGDCTLGAGTPRLPVQRAAESGAEGAEAGRAGVQQHRHRLRRAGARGGDEDELVTQVAGILDDAGHRLVMAAEGQRGADAQLEGLR
jgi:hypothetical protein